MLIYFLKLQYPLRYPKEESPKPLSLTEVTHNPKGMIITYKPQCLNPLHRERSKATRAL